VEELVSGMKKEKQLLETTDFGASSGGLRYQTSYERVKSIARTSSVSRQTGRLLLRIARFARPACVVELGTSLGISTMYLSRGAPDAVIHSLEGCAAKSTRANRNFDKLGVQNVISHIGQFDVLLDNVLGQIDNIDLMFLDGNHRQEPTFNYFEKCSEKAGNDSIFIIDDIRWSSGMKNAWDKIKNHPRVSVTLDLFSMGVVFFRKESTKQDFVLKF
jgi:predicted O-methyltransferase YrrM